MEHVPHGPKTRRPAVFHDRPVFRRLRNFRDVFHLSAPTRPTLPHPPPALNPKILGFRPTIFHPHGRAEARPSRCALHGEGRASARPRWNGWSGSRNSAAPVSPSRRWGELSERAVPCASAARTECSPHRVPATGRPQYFFNPLERHNGLMPSHFWLPLKAQGQPCLRASPPPSSAIPGTGGQGLPALPLPSHGKSHAFRLAIPCTLSRSPSTFSLPFSLIHPARAAGAPQTRLSSLVSRHCAHAAGAPTCLWTPPPLPR